MTVPKFTPGPWIVLPGKNGDGNIRIRGQILGCRWSIATVHCLTYDGSPDLNEKEEAESQANANLIAAAPQLAYTLHTLLQGVQAHLSPFDLKPEIEAATEALRAAGIDVRQPK